jgi:predicted GIY-YIG superfamily endonuclease
MTVNISDITFNNRILYVLKLNNEKYYVGQTTQLKRLRQHLNGNGSAFTKLHGVVSIVEVIPVDIEDYAGAEILENKKTIDYMNKFGWENVRGGFWSNCDEEAHRKSLLHHLGDIIKCGAHFGDEIQDKS